MCNNNYLFDGDVLRGPLELEEPMGVVGPTRECKTLEEYSERRNKYRDHLQSLPIIKVSEQLQKEWGSEGKVVVVEDVDFLIRGICPDCGGDGKETCHNPDHGFISAVGGETQRLGCPVCGHDSNHKTSSKYPCETCNGVGTTDYLTAETWLAEMKNEDDCVEQIAIPITAQPEKTYALTEKQISDLWDAGHLRGDQNCEFGGNSVVPDKQQYLKQHFNIDLNQ